MQATLTDVQKAIEQLGHSGGDTASFSFASSHGEYSEREEDMTEGGDSDDEPTDWHRTTRERLAERARQENEERQAREGQSSVPTTPLRLISPPIDVELSEESDEEDDDTEALRHTQRRRSGVSPDTRYSSQYPHIPEEDEAVDEAEVVSKFPPATQAVSETENTVPPVPPLPSAVLSVSSAAISVSQESDSGYIEPSEDFIVPSPSVTTHAAQEDHDEEPPPTATAERLTFPEIPPTNSPIPLYVSRSTPSSAANTTSPTPIPPSAPTPAALAILEAPLPTVTHEPIIPSVMPGSLNPLSPIPISPETVSAAPAPSVSPAPAAIKRTPAAIMVHAPIPSLAKSALPSPGRASVPSPGFPIPSPTVSSSGSVGYGSSAGIQQALTPATTMSFKTAGGSTPTQEPSPVSSQDGHKAPSTHPSEWTLEEVIEWLKSKGFDQGVCDKFVEQEITGDVLLELDANILKTEFGITAFGKRVRIVNAIAELRRPPSFSDSDHHPMLGLSHPASRTQSFNYGHSHNSSMASSVHQSYANSPLGYGGPGFGTTGFSPAPSQKAIASSVTLGSNGPGSLDSPRHMPVPDTSDFPASAGSYGRSGWRASDPGRPPAVASEVNLSTPRLGETRSMEPMPQVSELAGLGLGLAGSHPGSRPGSPEKASVRILHLKGFFSTANSCHFPVSEKPSHQPCSFSK
jgi:hypothetical protein